MLENNLGYFPLFKKYNLLMFFPFSTSTSFVKIQCLFFGTTAKYTCVRRRKEDL